uniref:ISXO2-like transposase domain-containing protein n=2 Tax=Clastoptera arizonana TaxID=38151 RepID=A0A1B6DV20_9HEMI
MKNSVYSVEEIKLCTESCSKTFPQCLEMDLDEIIDFLLKHGVLKLYIDCKKCHNKLKLNRKQLNFKCYARYSHQKKKRKQCTFFQSAKTGSFFYKSKIDLVTHFQMIALFLFKRGPRQRFIEEKYGIAQDSIVKSYLLYRDIFIYINEKFETKLGGNGKVVELKEAQFGNCRVRKDGNRYPSFCWAIGGVERGSNNCFFTKIEMRNCECLLAIIKKLILPGTTIISDCWKLYNCTNKSDFQKLSFESDIKLIHPKTKDDLSIVEESWADVRSVVMGKGCRPNHLTGYLAEYLFKRRYLDLNERMHHFFIAVAELYEPRYSVSTNLKYESGI